MRPVTSKTTAVLVARQNWHSLHTHTHTPKPTTTGRYHTCTWTHYRTVIAQPTGPWVPLGMDHKVGATFSAFPMPLPPQHWQLLPNEAHSLPSRPTGNEALARTTGNQGAMLTAQSWPPKRTSFLSFTERAKSCTLLFGWRADPGFGELPHVQYSHWAETGFMCIVHKKKKCTH